MSGLDPSARKTFVLEHFRSAFQGVFEPFAKTFFLLIAIQSLGAGQTGQAVVAASGGVGMLLSPIVIFAARQLRLQVAPTAGVLFLLGGVGLVFSAQASGLTGYVLLAFPAVVVAGSCIPLFTELYQQNYPTERRGTLFGRTQRVMVACAAVTAWLCGQSLAIDLGSWRECTRFFGVCLGAVGALLWLYPSRPLEPDPDKGNFPFRGLRWVARDRTYRWLITIWMLMGFGNLMMMPLRIVYLADPQFGFDRSPAFIALVTAVIPPVMLFLLTPMWGKLFDRMNFFLLRTILNVLFLVSIVFYFIPGTTWGFVVGAVFLGLAFSGGNIAWSLWVTKIAPPERVADYMSGHTFFTGSRAVIAPLISIPLAAVIPMEWMVVISCSFIIVSIAMLGPEIKTWHARRKAQPLTEDVAE